MIHNHVDLGAIAPMSGNLARHGSYLLTLKQISKDFLKSNPTVINKDPKKVNAEWCRDVLVDTIQRHGKPEIFNTDQGSQFTSEVFVKVLQENEVKISMDGKGRALDNIYIERFWGSLKR